MRAIEHYTDVVVLRHPDTGAARIAADHINRPLLNAGDGSGEHPTQALLDLFCIKRELARHDGLVVTMLGDLLYGRTVHSLATLLANYKVKINYVSPPQLKMPRHVWDVLASRGAVVQHETDSLESVLHETDVLYVTRVQKERFANEADYNKLKGGYVVDLDVMSRCKKHMIVMHPLPRLGEIDASVDHDPRAAYFRQTEAGLYMRMALLGCVLGKL